MKPSNMKSDLAVPQVDAYGTSASDEETVFVMTLLAFWMTSPGKRHQLSREKILAFHYTWSPPTSII